MKQDLIRTDNANLFWSLRSLDRPHKLYISGSSIIVEIPEFNGSSKKKIIFSESDLDLKTLGFIKSVKSDFKKSSIDPPKINPSDVWFFFNNTEFPGTYHDVIEVDINTAYWELALKMGLISQDIFYNGMIRKKEDRLIGLGSLATRKNVYEYDTQTGKYDYIESIQDERGRNAFFWVCATLGDIMKRAIDESGARIMFFWVDAFFIRQADLKKLAAFIHAQDLQFKVKPCSPMLVERINSGTSVKCLVGHEGEKSFFLPDKRQEGKTIKEIIDFVNSNIK